MQTYTSLILDDDILSGQQLSDDLHKYCKNIKTITIVTSIESAVEAYLENIPEILFLKIKFKNNETSFSFLKKIKPTLKSEIIFISFFEKYALKAIAIGAVGYLIKPIKINKLVSYVAKAIKNIDDKKNLEKGLKNTLYFNDLIAIPSVNKIDILHLNDILYIEADGRYTIFNLINGSNKIATKNLGVYEKQLDPKTFFRIHHSYIINLNMVTNINLSAGNYCELSNGKALPIAKRRQEKLHRFLKLK